MKITKQRRDFEKGTVIYRWDGEIILTSDYDSFHNWYEAQYLDDEGNPTGDTIRVTPGDLLGNEVF